MFYFSSASSCVVFMMEFFVSKVKKKVMGINDIQVVHVHVLLLPAVFVVIGPI